MIFPKHIHRVSQIKEDPAKGSSIQSGFLRYTSQAGNLAFISQLLSLQNLLSACCKSYTMLSGTYLHQENK